MTTMRVKVCGITRAADAEAAVRLGAAAVGFVFWPQSPRRVAPDVAAAIASALPALVVRVGVFVNAPVDEVRRVAQIARLQAVQLHGDEAVAPYLALPVAVIKAVGLTSDADVERAASLPAEVTALVDAVDPVRRGGTGRGAPRALAAALARRRPIVLAGGLSAENVGDAVAAVRPWGLDVSSGVEAAPGVKDAARLAAFFEAVRASGDPGAAPDAPGVVPGRRDVEARKR